MDSSKVSESNHNEPSCNDSGSISKNVNEINACVPIRKIYIHPVFLNVSLLLISCLICINRELQTNFSR